MDRWVKRVLYQPSPKGKFLSRAHFGFSEQPGLF